MNTVTLAYETIPPDMPEGEFLRLFLMYLEIRQRSTLFECLRFTVHRSPDLDLNKPQDRLSAGGTGTAVPASMAVA